MSKKRKFPVPNIKKGFKQEKKLSVREETQRLRNDISNFANSVNNNLQMLGSTVTDLATKFELLEECKTKDDLFATFQNLKSLCKTKRNMHMIKGFISQFNKDKSKTRDFTEDELDNNAKQLSSLLIALQLQISELDHEFIGFEKIFGKQTELFLQKVIDEIEKAINSAPSEEELQTDKDANQGNPNV